MIFLINDKQRLAVVLNFYSQFLGTGLMYLNVFFSYHHWLCYTIKKEFKHEFYAS